MWQLGHDFFGPLHLPSVWRTKDPFVVNFLEQFAVAKCLKMYSKIINNRAFRLIGAFRLNGALYYAKHLIMFVKAQLDENNRKMSSSCAFIQTLRDAIQFFKSLH